MKIKRRFKITLIISGLVVLMLSVLLGRMLIIVNNQTYYDELDDALQNPDKAEVLVMRNRKMKILSSDIGKLHNLKILNLGNNDLKYLPAEIGELKKLEELCLENNGLTSLPKELIRLVNLRKINVSRNNLNHFPALYPNELEEINLSDNNIMAFPGEIRNMKRLKIIDLAGNHIFQISEGVIFPDSIRRIDLFHNGLKSSPSFLFSLPSLRELILEENPLDERTAELYNNYKSH